MNRGALQHNKQKTIPMLNCSCHKILKKALGDAKTNVLSEIKKRPAVHAYIMSLPIYPNGAVHAFLKEMSK